MKTRIEEFLAQAPVPVCDVAGKEAVKERVLAGLREGQALEQQGVRGEVRREARRQANDRAIALGKLPGSAMVKRALLVPVLSLMLLVFLAAGVYALSADKNPDSLLYPLKLFFEQARLQLTSSDLASAELELGYADKRMAELQFMVSHRTSKGAQDWASGYEENLQETLDYGSRLQGDATINFNARINGLAQQHKQLLEALSREAPPELSPVINEARSVCDLIGDSPTDVGQTGLDEEKLPPPGQDSSGSSGSDVQSGDSNSHDGSGSGSNSGSNSGSDAGSDSSSGPGQSDDALGVKDSSWMEWPYMEWWKVAPAFPEQDYRSVFPTGVR